MVKYLLDMLELTAGMVPCEENLGSQKVPRKSSGEFHHDTTCEEYEPHIKFFIWTKVFIWIQVLIWTKFLTWIKFLKWIKVLI